MVLLGCERERGLPRSITRKFIIRIYRMIFQDPKGCQLLLNRQVTYKQLKFIPHSNRGWKYEIRCHHGQVLVKALFWVVIWPTQMTNFWLYLHMEERGWAISLASFYRGTNPFIRASHSLPNNRPKASTPHMTTSGIRFQHVYFGGWGTQTVSPNNTIRSVA